MIQRYHSPKFTLGRTLATPGALQALQNAGQSPETFLRRHLAGDWGELCDEDKQANNNAIAHEGNPDRQARILSTYHTTKGDKLWIITEADRSATTILLPEEY